MFRGWSVAPSRGDANAAEDWGRPPTIRELRRRLFNAVEPDGHFNRLFDYLPGVHFFAKDRDGRILFASSGLVRLYGYESEESLVGRTDFDFLPKGLAEKFRRDDMKVMDSGTPLVGIVELFPNRQGVPDWFLTDKLPLWTSDGRVVGLMGTIREHRDVSPITNSRGKIDLVVDYMRETAVLNDSIWSLAERCNLSIRQFEAIFREQYNLTPSQFRIRLRIAKACELLKTTRESVSGVAVQVGFYDQSALSHHFRRIMGPHHYNTGRCTLESES